MRVGFPGVSWGSYQDAGLCLDATEEHRAQLRPRVQLLPRHGHHAEAGLGQWLQALSPQLGHRGAQALWVLLRQHGWHLQQPGHLCQKGGKGLRPREGLDPWPAGGGTLPGACGRPRRQSGGSRRHGGTSPAGHTGRGWWTPGGPGPGWAWRPPCPEGSRGPVRPGGMSLSAHPRSRPSDPGGPSQPPFPPAGFAPAAPRFGTLFFIILT